MSTRRMSRGGLGKSPSCASLAGERVAGGEAEGTDADETIGLRDLVWVPDEEKVGVQLQYALVNNEKKMKNRGNLSAAIHWAKGLVKLLWCHDDELLFFPCAVVAMLEVRSECLRYTSTCSCYAKRRGGGDGGGDGGGRAPFMVFVPITDWLLYSHLR